MRTSHFIVLALMLSLVSCIEKDVRLYVEIDDSCETCCGTQEFLVLLNGQEEGRVVAGDTVLIEKVVTTAGILSIGVADDERHSENVDKCRQCVYPELDPALAAKVPEGVFYSYLDTIYFEDEDIHIDLTCSRRAR